MARRDYGRDRYGWNWRGTKRALQKRTRSGGVCPGQLDEFIADLRAAASEIEEPVVEIEADGDEIVVTGWKFATTAEIEKVEAERQRVEAADADRQADAVRQATETLARYAPERLSDDAR